jgi:hypothetical protein
VPPYKLRQARLGMQLPTIALAPDPTQLRKDLSDLWLLLKDVLPRELLGRQGAKGVDGLRPRSGGMLALWDPTRAPKPTPSRSLGTS